MEKKLKLFKFRCNSLHCTKACMFQVLQINAEASALCTIPCATTSKAIISKFKVIRNRFH